MEAEAAEVTRAAVEAKLSTQLAATQADLDLRTAQVTPLYPHATISFATSAALLCLPEPCVTTVWQCRGQLQRVEQQLQDTSAAKVETEGALRAQLASAQFETSVLSQRVCIDRLRTTRPATTPPPPPRSPSHTNTSMLERDPNDVV